MLSLTIPARQPRARRKGSRSRTRDPPAGLCQAGHVGGRGEPQPTRDCRRRGERGVGCARAGVTLVNAGAPGRADAWLGGLWEGGRLILPLTGGGFPNADVRHGAVFRITRQDDGFLAKRISGVAIFPCEGMRDAEIEAALAAAFAKGRVGEVTRLYRRDDVPEEDCWVKGAGLCLAYA